MGKHLLAKAHIAKLNKSTELEVTQLTSWIVDETALAILKSQGSRGIQIVSFQRKFTLDFRFYLYWLNCQTKRSKLAVKYFNTAKFHQDTCNRYLMLGFVLAHIPWNARKIIELGQSYSALPSALVPPSTSMLSNIHQREYTLTMDAVKMQLPSRNEVRLALDGWTSTNKLAIMLVIAYQMDRNWALHKVQLAFDDVDSQFFSLFER